MNKDKQLWLECTNIAGRALYYLIWLRTYDESLKYEEAMEEPLDELAKRYRKGTLTDEWMRDWLKNFREITKELFDENAT